tara:strand:- start:461 stop:721 length:261 start_codon:yes stop_codon:yes gene_type:complete
VVEAEVDTLLLVPVLLQFLRVLFPVNQEEVTLVQEEEEMIPQLAHLKVIMVAMVQLNPQQLSLQEEAVVPAVSVETLAVVLVEKVE